MVATNQLIGHIVHSGQLPALGTKCCIFHITLGGLFKAYFLLERCLDRAQNKILHCPQIACKFRLERLPNAASRQYLPRADGGADVSRDCGSKNIARNGRID